MKNKSHKYRNACIVILLCLLFYFLSEGFAYRLIRTDRMSYKTFNHIYGPIVWLNGSCVVCNRVISGYEDLWYSDYVEINKWIDRATPKVVSTNQPAGSALTNQPAKSNNK